MFTSTGILLSDDLGLVLFDFTRKYKGYQYVPERFYIKLKINLNVEI